MLTKALIDHILATIPHQTVGLLGDLFLDRYLDIDPGLDEPSIETGLTAYQVVKVRSYPGALGTVINNLSALGVGRIYPIAVIGDDGEGYELRQALDRTPGVLLDGIVIHPDRQTPTYTKPMVLTTGGPSRELNRLDIKNRTPTPAEAEDAALAALNSLWPRLDALIVLDQVSEADCGVVTARVRDRVAELASGEPGKFALADSRERVGLFRNVCVKPNQQEVKEGVPDAKAAFVTRGADGILLFEEGMSTGRIVPGYPVNSPIDICGAGDSCSAGITCAKVSGATHEQAAAFGNLVASITVQQIGTTGTATPDQVRARWREVNG
jgi:bifunctional ADP-heptose synthase (sugar kinase/adenylyltransferase)